MGNAGEGWVTGCVGVGVVVGVGVGVDGWVVGWLGGVMPDLF